MNRHGLFGDRGSRVMGLRRTLALPSGR